MPATVGSMLLSSTNPQRLRDFYAQALDVKPEQTPDGGYDLFNLGGFYVLIDTRDDIGDRNPEPGRLIVNIDVDDARATADRLEAAGATWLAPLEDRDGNFFATAIDPDGNYLQIIQLSAAARAEMEG
ncbi:MAG: VOC family protein [Thermocrispum sp.]